MAAGNIFSTSIPLLLIPLRQGVNKTGWSTQPVFNNAVVKIYFFLLSHQPNQMPVMPHDTSASVKWAIKSKVSYQI